MVTIAQGSPFLVILRCTDVTRPLMVTLAWSGQVAPSVSESRSPTVQSALLARTCSRPSNGWSET